MATKPMVVIKLDPDVEINFTLKDFVIESHYNAKMRLEAP